MLNWEDFDYETFFIARLTTAGVLDTSFGENGSVFQFGLDALFQINSLALQPDGKILAATSAPLSMQGVIARLHEDGSFDSGFGMNGITAPPSLEPLVKPYYYNRTENDPFQYKKAGPVRFLGARISCWKRGNCGNGYYSVGQLAH